VRAGRTLLVVVGVLLHLAQLVLVVGDRLVGARDDAADTTALVVALDVVELGVVVGDCGRGGRVRRERRPARQGG